MVNDAPIAGSNFYSANIPVGRQMQRNHKTPRHVLAFGGNGIRLGHLKDHVGLAQLPAVRELRRRRQVGRIAFGRSVRGPLLYQCPLLVRQPPLALKLAVAGFQLPGRHQALFGDNGNLLRPFRRVTVRQQGKRSHFVRPMTIGAVVEEDGRNVFAECRRVGARRNYPF